MSARPDIRLVVFDLGRVLVGLCDNWQQACRIARVPIPFKELSEPERGRLAELVRDEEIGAISPNEFCQSASELFAVDPQHVWEMSDAYLLAAFPGVSELISELHAAKLQTACLSNTNSHHWQLMLDPTRPCNLPIDTFTHRF